MGFGLSSVSQVLSWARSKSLWYYRANTGCCADEFLETIGCRYDLERFGCLPQVDPSQADLLIVSGAINLKLAPKMIELYQAMPNPKYVLAIGACACGGGAYNSKYSYSVIEGVNQLIPVDVFVPGCPPRPEAIMNGLITLQEKIGGRTGIEKSYQQ